MHGHRRIKVGEFIGGINPKNAASWPNQCFFLSRQYDVSISKASSFLSFSPHFLLILLNCGEKKEAFDPRESWPSQELPGCWVNFSSPWMVVSGEAMSQNDLKKKKKPNQQITFSMKGGEMAEWSRVILWGKHWFSGCRLGSKHKPGQLCQTKKLIFNCMRHYGDTDTRVRLN